MTDYICPTCGETTHPSPSHVGLEYFGPTERVGNQYTAICQEQVQCPNCGEPIPLRQGTAYWLPLDWDTEQPPTRIVWEQSEVAANA